MPIVNIQKEPFEVYVGRRFLSHKDKHFGNPFSHIKNSMVAPERRVATREEAILCFEAWILGEAFEEIEPDRRLWILQNVKSLKGKVLGCHCKPLACHAEILERLANE
jgi:hypothetical protein